MKNFQRKISSPSPQKMMLTFFGCLALICCFQSCLLLEFIAPHEAATGSEIEVQCKIKNNRVNTSGGNIAFFLSADRFLESESDHFINNINYPAIQSGATELVTAQLSIPENINAGKYYLIAWSGFSEMVREIQIIGDIGAPDLIPVNFVWKNDYNQDVQKTKDLSSGEIPCFYFSLKNSGLQNTFNVKTNYYISSNSSLESSDILVGSHSGITLSGTGIKDLEGSFSIDPSLGSNLKYLILVVDPDNTTTELNENNNIIVKRINLGSNTNIMNPNTEEEPAFPEAELREEESINQLLEKDILLYPNPAQNLIKLSFNLPQSLAIQANIFDANGKLMRSFSQQKETADFSQQFDVSNFPNGLYLVKVQIGAETFTKKLMIQK